jgi:arylsulfatase A-like enzyme
VTNQPTVLLITCDQLRRDALGCYGGKAVATPNLDRLAATGTVFDRAYTASPWCLPSRSSILTGRYPRNHGAYSNFRDVPLSRNVPNLYTVLGQAGYRVGHIGKCHYVPVPYGDTRPDATLPYGEFRDYYLSLGIDDLWLQDDKQVSVWFNDDYAAELAEAGHLEAYRAAVWDSSARKVFPFPGPAEWHPDRWVGRKAAEYLSGHTGGQPLFAWVSFSGPHFPFDPPEEYLDRVDDDALGEPDVRPEEFADERRIHHRSFHGPQRGWIEGVGGPDVDEDYWRRLRRNYAANVAMLDDEVGRVLVAAQERFGDDLEVVFSCDHGEMLGNHGFWGKANCFYEDVLNVPLLHRSAGGAGAGTRSDALVSLVDVAPTLAAAATASGGLGDVDGRILGGAGHEVVLAEGEGFVTVTDGRYKLAVVRKQGFAGRELFDLLEDPGEFTDVSGRPEYAAIERDLTAAALDALVDTTLT